MRQLLRRSRPKLRERIAEGQMGDELEELVRGGLVFLIFDSRDFQWPFHSGSTNAQDLSKGQPGMGRDIAPKERCKKEIGAVEGTRTPTGFHPPAPKAGASANSATTAGGYFNSSAGHFRDVYEFRSTKPSPGGTVPAGRWPKKNDRPNTSDRPSTIFRDYFRRKSSSNGRPQ
jgi:hypothetical protein